MARLDKEEIRRSFDHAAETYDEHALVQTGAAADLVGRIGSEPRHILDLGCGTGVLTALVRERCPRARIVAVDFAPAMIALTRARVPDAEVLVTDIEELELVDRFDLVVSNATIQWLPHPQAVLRRLAESSRRLLLATFGPRTFWELDTVFEGLGVQRGFQLRSEREWRRMLPFAIESREQVVTYPSCAAFLQALRGVGATAGAARQPHGALVEAMKRYDRLFAVDGGVQATYEHLVLEWRP